MMSLRSPQWRYRVMDGLSYNTKTVSRRPYLHRQMRNGLIHSDIGLRLTHDLDPKRINHGCLHMYNTTITLVHAYTYTLRYVLVRWWSTSIWRVIEEPRWQSLWAYLSHDTCAHVTSLPLAAVATVAVRLLHFDTENQYERGTTSIYLLS